jgi:anti-anti-sigma factor
MAASLDDALVVHVGCTATAVQVGVCGELDLSNAFDLREVGFSAVDLAARTGHILEIDLGGVSFCDSAGMRTLVELQDEATIKRVTTHCVAVHDSVRYVADILGLSELFDTSTS